MAPAATQPSSVAQAGPPSLDFTNINRHNFSAALPIMRAAIQDATFVAIDTEFTGLSHEGMAEDLYDTYEERYKRLQASASSFIVCQFGLTTFKWHPPAGPGRPGHWEARAFNAYIFPLPDEFTGYDKRFLCQASSLSYLASQGFDFNRMMRDGIGYLPLALLDAKARELQPTLESQARGPQYRNPLEEEAAAEWRAAVLTWLAGSEPVLQLPLPRGKRRRSLQRAVVQSCQLPSLGLTPFSIEELIDPFNEERKRLEAQKRGMTAEGGGCGGGSGGGEEAGLHAAGAAAASAGVGEAGPLSAHGLELEDADEDGSGPSAAFEGADGSVEDEGEGESQAEAAPLESASEGEGEGEDEEDDAGQGDAVAAAGVGGQEQGSLPDGYLVLRRLDRWNAKDLVLSSNMQVTARQRLELLAEQSGFSQVLAALRDARRPVVAHNAAFDLAYVLGQFAEPLPRSWAAYKALAARTFPGGLFDTKYIAQQLGPQLGSQLADTSLGGLYRSLVTESDWLRISLSVLDKAPGGGGSSLPEIQLAPGFRGYEGLDAAEKAHEAGFDSLMTGAVFARLLRVAEARTGGSPAPRAPEFVGEDGAACGSSSDGGAAATAAAAGALLRPMHPYRGRIHMMRSDLPYANIYGTDPTPHRPAMLHVSGFTPATRPGFLATRFREAGLGSVGVSMLRVGPGETPAALVQLSSADLVQTALQTARKTWSAWKVVTFAEYYSRRRQSSQQRVGQQQPQQQRDGQRQAGQAGAAPARAPPRMLKTPAAEGTGDTGQAQGRGEAAGTVGSSSGSEGSSSAAAGAATAERQRASIEQQRISAFVQQVTEKYGRRNEQDKGARLGSEGARDGRDGAASAMSAAGPTSSHPQEAAASAAEAPSAAQPDAEPSPNPPHAASSSSGSSGGHNAAAQAALAAEKLMGFPLAAKRVQGPEVRDGKPAPQGGSLQRPARPTSRTSWRY